MIRMVQGLEQSGLKLVVNKVGFGLLRHILTMAGGFFINKGVMDNNESEAAIAAIITLVGVMWSVLVKLSAKPDENTAPRERVIASGSAALLVVLCLMIPLLLGSGCATSANDVAMAKIAADTAANYYTQPNNAEYMVMEGTNLEWSIRGASRIVMSGPIPTKSIFPREEGTLKQVLDGATEITKTVALGAVGYQGVKALKAQKPTVVTTEKLVPVTGATP